MQIEFLASGWIKELNEMEDWLKTRTVSMKVKKDGKEYTIGVPMVLRPIRAYTLHFPREHLDLVLNTLKPKTKVDMMDGTVAFKKSINWLRKLLKLKKIPEPDKSKGEFPMLEEWKKNIRIVGLGIREDPDFTNESGVTQEAI